jgi:hypothetical protein
METQEKSSVGNNFQPVLTAVREARYSFQSPFFMQSKEFENLAARKAEISVRLQKLSDEIVEQLFDSIHSSNDEKLRQKLVELKRRVYNLRNISVADAAGLNLSGGLNIQINEYAGVLSEINNIFEIYTEKIRAEIEDSCASILEDEIFLASLEYSCPNLSVSKSIQKIKFSKWLKKFSTIYAYALKHITKTPPLFTFSQIYLPASKGIVKEDTFETVLNAEIFSELEDSLLNSIEDKSFQRLEMVTKWRSGDRYYFLVFRDNAVKILHYPATPFLEKTVNYFLKSESKNDYVSYQKFSDFISGEDSTQLLELIEKLKQDSIIFSYLIENAQTPFDSLIKIDADRRAIYENLRQTDGQIIASAQIGSEHRKIAQDISTLGIKTNPFYIGYNYAGQINSEQEKTANIFSKDLFEIADVFQADDNNSYNRAIILDLIEKCFETSGKNRLPFLELLTRALWLKVDEKVGQKDYSEKILSKVFDFQQETLKITGKLSTENIIALKNLLSENKKKTLGAQRDFRMCFVGAVDFQTPSFYVHNVFSGDERFTNKYLTKRKLVRFNPRDTSEEIVNVEVLPAWNIPQHRARRSFPTGFSFDRRSRQFFDETINAEDIEVVFEGTPVFFHRLTKKKLKFHYRGLALFQRLPIPYKLLLFDQTDFFVNSFAQTPPHCEKNETVFLDGLCYKSINLRRPFFCIGIELLNSYILEKDWIRGAYFFRDYIKKTLDIRSDYLYFRLIKDKHFTDTPRFLNLLHPLSWDIFRRSVLKSLDSDAVHFAECLPAPAQMFHKADGNHFTEFMIEI